MTVKVEIEAAIESFKLNELALTAMLRGPQGPVARTLASRAIRVESAAKINASQPPRNGPNSGSAPGGGPAVRTGRLRGSISWRLGEDEAGLFADIGTSVTYGVYVEKGTSRMAPRPFLVPALMAAHG